MVDSLYQRMFKDEDFFKFLEYKYYFYKSRVDFNDIYANNFIKYSKLISFRKANELNNYNIFYFCEHLDYLVQKINYPFYICSSLNTYKSTCHYMDVKITDEIKIEQKNESDFLYYNCFFDVDYYKNLKVEHNI